MKKIITLIVFVASSASVFSQTKFFIDAGINSSVPSFEGRRIGASSKEGRVGITASAGIINKLGNKFQLSNRLSFLTKNFHESFFVSPDYSGTVDYHLSGLQYHLLMEKDLTAKKKLHFIPGLGAYSTLHVGGDLNSVTSTLVGVIREDRDINFDKNGDFKKLDAGLTAAARLRFKNIGVNIVYDIGLVKTSNYAKTKWSSIHFTLGYFFN